MRFALVLVLVLSQGGPAPKTQHDQTIAGPEQRGTEKAPLVIKQDSAERESEARERDRERRERLAAERVISRDTRILAIATIILALGTMGLWWVTRRLAVGGERSAQRQLRAYVCIEEIFVENKAPAFPLVCAYKVVYTNSGQTPATEVRLNIATSIVTKGAALPVVPDTGPMGNDVLGPGMRQNYVSKRPVLNPAEIAKLRAGTHDFWLFGSITYLDIFGQKHITEYRYMRCADVHDLRVAEEGNRAD